jgi:hypothetical protein
MEFNPLFGRCLIALTVLEPWKDSSTRTFGLPLFGAIVLEFDCGTALVFKSPLRYARTSSHASLASFLAADGLREARAAFRHIVCDMDQLGFHKRALVGSAGVTQPSSWRPVLPVSHNSLAPDNLPDLQQLHGHAMLGMSAVSGNVFELRFSGQDFPIWLTYREDLDGAIQVAWAGWDHRITEVVVTEPDHAFGWLHPDAPYPICAKAREWPNIGRYIKWAHWEATRSQRDPHGDDGGVLLAIHEDALRMKFECHPQLARRFAAIRYPIAGLSDMAIQALTRLRATYPTSPAS